MNKFFTVKLNESKEDRQKFINWLKSEYSEELAINFCDNFIKLKSNIKSPYNDFYYWMKNESPKIFVDYFNEIVNKHVEKQDIKQKESKGSRLIYSDSTWKVYEITTYEAAAKYGKGTRWCISGSKVWGNGEDGESYFNNYHNSTKVQFYFFIKNNGEKYALALYPDNKGYEIYNAEDIKVAFIPDAPQIKEIPVDYFTKTDLKILVNAFISNKFPQEISFSLISDVIVENCYSEKEGYCGILNGSDFANMLDENIPDGWLEHENVSRGVLSEKDYKKITGEDYNEIWYGDYSRFDPNELDYDLDMVNYLTKQDFIESCKLLKFKNIQYKWVLILENVDDYETNFELIKDWQDLLFKSVSYCDIDNWKQDVIDNFYNEFGNGSKFDIFSAMCVKEFIDKCKEGEIKTNTSFLKSIGVSDEFINSLSLKESLIKENTGRDTFIFNGKKAWSGAVNTLDGTIEEVHSYKQAQKVDFHHSFYFSETQLDKMEEGESCFFCVFENNSIMINPMFRFNPSDTEIELDEEFLKRRIKEQIKFITNESLKLINSDNSLDYKVLYTSNVYELKYYIENVLVGSAMNILKIVYYPISNIWCFADGYDMNHAHITEEVSMYLGIDNSKEESMRFLAYKVDISDNEVIDYFDKGINIYNYDEFKIADLGYDFKSTSLYKILGKSERVTQFNQEYLNEKYLNKFDNNKKLLKSCGKFVYHCTSTSQLKNIFENGLQKFWFGIEPDECIQMVQFNHNDYKNLVLIEIRTSKLNSDLCDFTYDVGNGYDDIWVGTGFYNGNIKSFHNIYLEDGSEMSDEELSKYVNLNHSAIIFESLKEIKEVFSINLNKQLLLELNEVTQNSSNSNNYDKIIYRVGELPNKFKNNCFFFAEKLEYFNYSQTGYDKEDAEKYLLNTKDFKVFDPMIEWKDNLDIESWSVIRTTEEFAREKDLYITQYFDIDYEDPNEYHEVLIDTDSLAMYGRDNNYDVTILRDIPGGAGYSPDFTEYAIHNSECIIKVREDDDLKENLTKEQENYFKNSKIRDENGNLLVCYHGTSNPGFNEFDHKDNNSRFGNYKFGKYNINFFVTTKEVAKGYTNIGVEQDNNIYACYLNIVNPYIVNNETEEDVENFIFKTWNNIKDNNIRNKQIEKFNSFWKKWGNKKLNKNDIEYINKDLAVFNVVLKSSLERDSNDSSYYDKDENYYDLVFLGENTFYGGKHILMYSYELSEIFDNDNYEEIRDHLVGDIDSEKDDYYLTTNDIIRFILNMNEEDGTDYDGIIISDIYDVGPTGSMFEEKTTDIITLKSSNQIKKINNKHPTNSNNINEKIERKDFDSNSSFYITDNVYDAKNKILSYNEGVRVFIDKSIPVYLIGTMYDVTHTGMIVEARKYGWNVDYDSEYDDQICICIDPTCNESGDWPDDMVSDHYYTRYYYSNFEVWAELEKDFTKFELSKVLGKIEDVDVYSDELDENLQEKIIKKENKWQVQSEKGRNLGTYNTKKEAEKRLKQVHYFKHVNEDINDKWNYKEISQKIVDSLSNITSWKNNSNEISIDSDVDIIDDWNAGCDIDAAYYDEYNNKLAWLQLRVYQDRQAITFRQLDVFDLKNENSLRSSGFAEKLVSSILEVLSKETKILVHMDLSGGFWYHMSQKFKDYNWDKSLHENLKDEINNSKSVLEKQLDEYTYDEALQIVKSQIINILKYNDINIKITGLDFTGSRRFGNFKEGSDLDLRMTYEGDEREDTIFNVLHDEEFPIVLNDFIIDINPIQDGDIITLINKDKNYIKDTNENYKKENSLLEMKGKEIIKEQRILDLIKLSKNTFSKAGYHIDDDIKYMWGDTLHTFGTMCWPEYENDKFTLVLNKHMINEPDDPIINTICHELCHYVVMKDQLANDIIYWYSSTQLRINRDKYNKSIDSSHGRAWKHIASTISNLIGTKINTTDTYETHTGVGEYAKKANDKYIVKCKNCGWETHYNRATDFVKNPNQKSKYGDWYKYGCPKCHAKGQFKTITNESLITESIEDQVFYHGSSSKFDKFNTSIVWCSENKEYAKTFAIGEEKYLYTCKLNLKNTLDVGNTDLNFFNLFPVLPPYRLSSYTKNICKKLNIEEKELADLVVYTSAGEDVREQYKMDIHTITRLPQFKELCVKAGFDSIKATEGGNITYGVFDSNLIEILDIKDLKK